MSSRLPGIGITAAIERVRWGVWDEVVTMAPRSYARAVEEAGALPLILPPGEAGQERVDAALERIDALILTGGPDLDPAGYGAEPHPETVAGSRERDDFELELTRRAIDRGMPVLGVCRGMQMLNLARGGALIQHLPDLTGNDVHRHTPGAFGDHEVRLEPGSLAALAAGGTRALVKSHHHQGVGELGEGLAISGRSLDDDVVEAIELPDHRFVLGVLWHPEEDDRSRVIAALVAVAREQAVAA